MLWKAERLFIHNHETAEIFLCKNKLKSWLISNLIRLSTYVYRLPIWVYAYGTGPYAYGQKYSYGMEHVHYVSILKVSLYYE